MTLCSAIYEGHVRHRRRQPRDHEFVFPLFMVYLDLAEIEQVFSLTRWWSADRAAPARFQRSDYLGDRTVSLDKAVRDRVANEIGLRPGGPVRLLTHLKYFGYCFNPVSFYYCYAADGATLEAIVAEITNVPWKERHSYVLDARGNSVTGSLMRWEFQKDFHVSPFMPMDMGYDWRFSVPGDRILVHMNLWPTGWDGVAGGMNGGADRPRTVFDATLQLERHELTPARMRSQVLRYPFLTARVVGRIHFEALRLWLKGVNVHQHPNRAHVMTVASEPSNARIGRPGGEA